MCRLRPSAQRQDDGLVLGLVNKRLEPDERKQQICDAAIELFRMKGVSGTSVRDVAAAAGVTTGSLYHHFRSKAEIVDTVASSGIDSVHHLREYYKTLSGINLTEALRRCVIYWMLRADERRNYIMFYLRDWRWIPPARASELTESARQFLAFFEHLIDEGVRSGEFRTGNARLVAFNIWALGQEWAMRGWFLRETFTPAQFAEQQAEAVLTLISIRCPTSQQTDRSLSQPYSGGDERSDSELMGPGDKTRQ